MILFIGAAITLLAWRVTPGGFKWLSGAMEFLAAAVAIARSIATLARGGRVYTAKPGTPSGHYV